MNWESVASGLAKRITKLERTAAPTLNQRRDYITDINGNELWDYGDAGNPASFEFFLPPDLREFMRYEIRLRIKKFRTPVSAGVGNTKLNITGSRMEDLKIDPNPHTHSIEATVTEVASNPTNFTFALNGYDFTDEIKATFPEWPTSFGSFPSNGTFDFKLLAENLPPWKRGLLLSSGVKNISIGSNDLFECRLVLYLKYSHKGRGGLY